MNFARVIASSAAIVVASLSGQANATQFLHFQIDWTGGAFGSNRQIGSGSLSFDRPYYRSRGSYNLSSNDNMSCRFSLGACAWSAVNTLPPQTLSYDQVYSYLNVNGEPSNTYWIALLMYPRRTIGQIGTFTSSLDNVQSTLTVTSFTGKASGPVPEPATWALMIVGFGAVGAAMRRVRPSRFPAPISFK